MHSRSAACTCGQGDDKPAICHDESCPRIDWLAGSLEGDSAASVRCPNCGRVACGCTSPPGSIPVPLAAWRPEERAVFLVMGRSYEDSYVESIWETREAAEKRAAELPSDPPDYFQYEVIARGVM